MRLFAGLITLCLCLLGVAEAARAFEITGGLNGYQVIQRGPDGTGSIVLAGRTGSEGRLKLRLRDCHITSESIYRYLRQDLVVPFSMEGIAFNVECGDLFIGDLEAGRVEV